MTCFVTPGRQRYHLADNHCCAQREAKLSATRNRFRINVEPELEVGLEDEESNPLEAYYRLVYWTVENYPQGRTA